jgi:hypothetical protein
MKGWADYQQSFYQKAITDSRLSPAHISLYFALLHEAGHTLALPFYLRRESLMRKAKICSPVTLNKCLRGLHEYGYIGYRPSFVPGQSMAMLIEINDV